VVFPTPPFPVMASLYPRSSDGTPSPAKPPGFPPRMNRLQGRLNLPFDLGPSQRNRMNLLDKLPGGTGQGKFPGALSERSTMFFSCGQEKNQKKGAPPGPVRACGGARLTGLEKNDKEGHGFQIKAGMTAGWYPPNLGDPLSVSLRRSRYPFIADRAGRKTKRLRLFEPQGRLGGEFRSRLKPGTIKEAMRAPFLLVRSLWAAKRMNIPAK